MNNTVLKMLSVENFASFAEPVIFTTETDISKKEYLEKLVKIEELMFVKDNDYGYHAVPIIFNYLELIKLEIETSNREELIKYYFNNIEKALNYIIN